MLFLIFSLIVCFTTSTDVVEHLMKSVFDLSKTPIKITRTHLNPQEKEIFKEYIYKQGYKIRIDVDSGDSIITTFVYNGKTGFIEGKPVSRIGSLEMVLYGCKCGYLLAMEKTSFSLYEGREIILVSGKQGNKLYLEYGTLLPMRWEFTNKTVVFKEYKKIDGLGKVPFLIVKSSLDEVDEITRITDVEKQVSISRNFFSVPKQEIETLD